ncbi:MAG TPA: hydantoinase/oxoprolinase family protein [Stellaceae bacterium]|nr:hydantoinase/oxoprolinase family protein [Stellaceae bacterium]
MAYRLGIDIGGTFTDFSLLDEATGRVRVLKTQSVATKPEEAIFDGIRQLLAEHAVRPEHIRYFIHGTTLAVNTIIQRRGHVSALLVTAGFRDILNIGRHRIPDVFNFFTELPVPLVPRSRVFEIPERCLADGTVLKPLDEEAVRRAGRSMVEAGVEAVAVCFLHSYRNGANERRAREILAAEAPDLHVSLASEIWPQMREYERALVAVMNAYVGRRMERYFSRLEEGLGELGLGARVLSTKSNGGIMPAGEAGERPVETLLSGPAAGVIGAAFVGAASGHERLITFDMGGTSADVAVIEKTPHYSTESHVGDFPVIMPAVHVTSIGAGGGSIAWTDSTGVLKVGPQSAGAAPGPACYGQGGREATVTDAYVALGIIDPVNFLGGRMALDRGLAEAALTRLGRPLDLDPQATAEAILRVATSQMYATLVPLLARRGVGYEDYTLFAFGGAGPSHAFLLARDVGIQRVLVPRHPGVLCAAGSLVADLRKDMVETVHRVLGQVGAADLMRVLAASLRRLTAAGEAWIDAQGLDFPERRLDWAADMRYLGQSFELTVPLSEADVADETGSALRSRFHQMYVQVYGYGDENADLEILDLRVTAIAISPKRPLERLASGREIAAPEIARRDVYIGGRQWPTGIYQRDELAPGFAFDGPAIVEQFDTTVFVTPGWRVSVDAFGNLIGTATDKGDHVY